MTSAPNAIENVTRPERVPSLIEDGPASLSYTCQGRVPSVAGCVTRSGFEPMARGTEADFSGVPHEWGGNRP
jgi:hypothetical protein